MIAYAFAFLAVVAGATDLDAAREAQVRGAELHRQGELSAALAEFDRAVHLAPQSALAWYNRGLVRRELDDCEAAIGDFSRAVELQSDFFNALYQRGNCRQALGDYAQAAEDYGRAASLPGRNYARFLAYFGRADAERRLGMLQEAKADYTRVMELRGDTRALRSRAWVNFYLGRWRDTHDDASKYVHDTQAKEPDAAYAVILAVLALRRGGDADEAKTFLATWKPKVATENWPAPLLAYLESGDEAQVVAAAREPGQLTEALAYVGVALLDSKERARGVQMLRQVVTDGEPGYFEYDLAYHELRRLGMVLERRAAKR